MNAGLLTWSVQVSAHAAFVESRQIESPPALAPVGHIRRQGVVNRQRILNALRDGKTHPFCDLCAALPGMSRQGIYWLCDQLKAEGHIDWTGGSRSRRLYQLAKGEQHEH